MEKEADEKMMSKLDLLSDAFGEDIVVFMLIRKKRKTKKILASKLLRDFNEDLQPDDDGGEYIG